MKSRRRRSGCLCALTPFRHATMCECRVMTAGFRKRTALMTGRGVDAAVDSRRMKHKGDILIHGQVGLCEHLGVFSGFAPARVLQLAE